MAFYRTLKPGIWLMKLPWIGAYLAQRWIPEQSDANWFLPAQRTLLVGESLPTGQQCALSETIVLALLESAAGIFAMHACPCRTAFRCQRHPWEIGCLHLGPAALAIPASLGRRLSLDQARRHLQAALQSGLLPTILHIPSEADLFEVPPTQMLSICFCCECCCDVRLLLRQGPERYWEQYNHRLPGLRIVVDPACNGCGDCIEACYGQARVIQVRSGRAEILERCIACGRCIPACPQGALSLEIDPQVDITRALMARIAERVQIEPHIS